MPRWTPATPTDSFGPPTRSREPASNLGGVRVAEIARAIEERGRAGEVEDVDAMLADLDVALIELTAALERARARRWTSA